MAKIKVTIPEIRFRKETVEVPVTRIEQVRQVLAAQQQRVNELLSRRNEEVSKQLDKASRGSRLSSLFSSGGATAAATAAAKSDDSTSAGGRLSSLFRTGGAAVAAQAAKAEAPAPTGGRFSGILRLSRQNPEAAQKLDQAAAAAAASSNGGGSGARFALLGLGALAGAGAGAAIVARRMSSETRAQVIQTTTSVARTAGRQGVTTARTLGTQARGRAAAARSRIGQARAQELEPETITDRVRTELGEDQSLRHLPRINVNTEPGGIVYLRGPVPSERERELAEQIARRQRGVSEVINEIHVEGSDAVQ